MHDKDEQPWTGGKYQLPNSQMLYQTVKDINILEDTSCNIEKYRNQICLLLYITLGPFIPFLVLRRFFKMHSRLFLLFHALLVSRK